MMPNFWHLPICLTQFSKFNNFLWVCWFLGKNLSNFVPLVWKLHNPYCHNGWSTCKKMKLRSGWVDWGNRAENKTIVDRIFTRVVWQILKWVMSSVLISGLSKAIRGFESSYYLLQIEFPHCVLSLLWRFYVKLYLFQHVLWLHNKVHMWPNQLNSGWANSNNEFELSWLVP